MSVKMYNKLSNQSKSIEDKKRELENKTSPSKAQLDMLADYILFGKDQNGYSPVDKGEIEIETKYKSYKKK